jgi:hypothetical protein
MPKPYAYRKKIRVSDTFTYNARYDDVSTRPRVIHKLAHMHGHTHRRRHRQTDGSLSHIKA